MPPVATLEPTTAPSVSPPEVIEHDHGLTLAPGLDYDTWMSVGKKQATNAGASMWRLGDWLAYGQTTYKTQANGKRIFPDKLYAQIAAQIGANEITLRNAKIVCSRLALYRRRERLSFGHAQDIVSRAPEKDWDLWIARVVDEGLSVKVLREQLRKAKATYKPEQGDVGVVSILETYRQFVRDHAAITARTPLTPPMRRELLKILTPVLRDLG